jgi:hypothetical protein
VSASTATRPAESGWLADTPVEDSLLRRFLANQADQQTVLVSAIGGRAEQSTDVSLSDTGLPLGYLNQAVLHRPVLSADDPVLDEVSAFFGADQRAAVLVSAWPIPDLRGRGWELVGHPMFVVRGPVEVIEPPGTGVAVRSAGSADDLALIERLVAEGYPMPELAAHGRNAVLGAGLLNGPLHYVIGSVDDEPVSAAAVHVAHGVVNLCMAATLASARRRGVWRALVAARCAEAPELPAAAFTSDYSRPGFVRMGFLPVTRFTLWALPG